MNETLKECVRSGLGWLHPSLSGGGYLEHYLYGDREIARIELQSMTADVVSVIAMQDRGRIRYRITDELDSDFSLERETSVRPLSLQGMVRFLEGSTSSYLPGSVALGYNTLNAEYSSRRNMRYFTSISSDLYPQLHTHFERVFDAWVAEEEEDQAGAGSEE